MKPVLLALAICLSALPALAQSRLVASPAELAATLAQGAAGAELLLAPGNYGRISLPRGGVPAAIRSADPANPAVIGGLSGASFDGLRLEGLAMDYTFANGDTVRTQAFSFRDCRQLEIIGNRIVGDMARGMSSVDDGYPVAIGLWIENCEDVTIDGNLVSTFHRGMVTSRVTGLAITRNDITAIRSDGINIVQVENVEIVGNHMHDFARSIDSPDHADMIQMWTRDTDRPSRNILIRGNILNSGSGAWTQSIFMRNDVVDRGVAGREMFYQSITIEENVILNAHVHGITVGETNGLTIRRNTLVQNRTSAGENPDRALWVPAIRVSPASRDVMIEDNITHAIAGVEEAVNWRVSGNLLLPTSAYGQVFQGMMGGDPTRLETFRYRADGPAGAGGLGAAWLLP